MSFTDSRPVITSSYSAATPRSGVIFLAKVVIIGSLLAEFSGASSIGGGGSSANGAVGVGGSSGGLESIIGGGGGSSSSGGGGAGGSSSGGGNGGSYYSGTEVWFRNLDTQLLRLGSRLDQLMIRMDHLDSRVGRVQSQGHLRFDSIETSMQTTRQRLDLWSNQLNLIEEQLSRKWKNMESRFDSLVSSIDSKLDTKFNLIQRDNRRHNEYISSSFNAVIISQEKLSERVVNSLSEMNSTVGKTKNIISNLTTSVLSQVAQACSSNNTFLRSCPQNPAQHPSSPSSSSPYFHPPPSYNSHQQPNSTTTQVQLITTKVANMFDELVKRSQNLEGIVKDTFTMSNLTRREVQDGFRDLIPIVNQISIGGNNGGGAGARSVHSSNGASSAEVMSTALLIEAVTTVESISTNLLRRMGSIDERFEMVSMLVNNFMESCLRIQEKAPLIEEKMAFVLDGILDTIFNSTRNATEAWEMVKTQLLKEQQQLRDHYLQHHHHQPHPHQSKRNTSSCSDNLITASLQRSPVNQQHQQRYAASQGHNVNQATTTTGAAAGEYPNPSIISRDRSSSLYPAGASSSSSWGRLYGGGVGGGGDEDDPGLETRGSDHENIVAGAGLLMAVDENEGENNGDNDDHDHVDGDDDRHHHHPDSGGEDESEEPLKISRSKLLSNRGKLTSSNSHQNHRRHHHHHHQQYQHHAYRSGGGGGGNVNRNGNPSTNPADPYPIPYPSTTNSEGGIASISGTNIRSPPQTPMTFSSHHNGNDNVNLAQQGLGSTSSLSPALLGVPRMGTSDNNNGMGVVSSSGSSGAHVNSNSHNHNHHNGGDLHGGGGGADDHLDVEELSEEDKKRFWESWLSPPRRGSVPE